MVSARNMDDTRDFTIWQHMLGQIGIGKETATVPASTSHQFPDMEQGYVQCSSAVRVRLLDRPSSTTAILSWSDPTSCRYAYQCWRVSRAESTGICVLSGAAIAKGDEVYKPRLSGTRPRNANAMILRRMLDRPVSVTGRRERPKTPVAPGGA
ncbi:hypothetical protein BZM27_40840 [Paraburkholderia steynii]|uniref:DUF3331 domain-containing protein n=1 Tax=Paraburkholderia steynii TaxID=1245441 RepID=A0A4R0X3L6_9BURK|nr:hypothetical protein BZM27_40840 [Paraburkholderia steynii]